MQKEREIELEKMAKDAPEEIPNVPTKVVQENAVKRPLPLSGGRQTDSMMESQLTTKNQDLVFD